MDWCAVWVAFGAKWHRLAAESAASFRAHHPEIPVYVVADAELEGFDNAWVRRREDGMTTIQASRWAKCNLDTLELADAVLYLDADTTIQGRLDGYIEPLRAGFDLTITPSLNQGRQILRHVALPERQVTLDECGLGAVQWQAGAFAFRHSDATRDLFYHWRREWLRWQGADQGALMRALTHAPARIWALGRDFNGGSMVAHRSAGG